VNDGTGRLCDLLYGKEIASKYIGGSEAPMLHDAADEITRLREERDEARKRVGELENGLVDLLRAIGAARWVYLGYKCLRYEMTFADSGTDPVIRARALLSPASPADESEDAANTPSIDEPCPHPARRGAHEVYTEPGGRFVCRACGARGVADGGEESIQPPDEENRPLVAKVTRAIREADQTFQRTGGSSRHWVYECFFPSMRKYGLSFITRTAEEE